MSMLGIYVFSGTGNTLMCARELKSALDGLGIVSWFSRIEDGSEKAQEEDLVLCYPVYGFNAPKTMVDFCRGLNEHCGRVWFLKTSGEPLRLNDNSSAELTKILRNKGYEIMGEFHYIMPYNMVFRHSDEVASLMWDTAKERIPEAAELIAQGKTAPVKPTLSSKLMSGICRIEHWFYPKNGHLYRVDTDRCIHCMSCVNNCPTGNIRYKNGKFSFGPDCTGCCRCSFRCPAAAIHIGLLEFMKVNGPYNFGKDPEKAVIGRYCRKSYKKYFEKE